MDGPLVDPLARVSSRRYSIAMAQYDDFSNPPSRPSSPGDSELSDRFGDFNGVGSADSDWRNRASSVSRRRNQWRQYKHMTPDFGSPRSEADRSNAGMPSAPSSTAPSAAKTTALPSFRVKPSPPPGGPDHPAGMQPPLRSGLPMPQGLPGTPAAIPTGAAHSLGSPSLHPHSTAMDLGIPAPVAPASAGAGRPAPGGIPSPTGSSRPPAPSSDSNTVTPLRTRPRDHSPDRHRHREGRRQTTALTTGMAAVVAATTAGLAALAIPPNPEDGGTRQRRFSPQRRLAKLPPLALYTLRLAILGIGVAAIAGTLLSVFSPSNVVSTSGDTTTATDTRRGNANAIPGQGAVSVAALQPSSEITRLKAQLEQLATLTPGLTPAVYAFDIDSGRYVDLNGTPAVAAASTIKVPILVAFLQQVDAGNLALNQSIMLQEHHRVGGSGNMINDAVGSEYTALDVATRMIIHSDNTATNMMIEALGGQEALNQQFATWGLDATVLRNPLPDLEGTNTVSSRDLALLMVLVDQGDVLSRRSRERLLSIMQRTENRSLIAYNLTDGSLVANKTGDIASALGDVALVDTPNGNRYALSIMVQRPNNDGRASELIRRITETVHREMNQPLAPVGRAVSPGNAPETESNPANSEANPVGPLENVEGQMDSPMEATPEDTSPTQPSRGTPPGTTPSGEQIPPG